MGGKGKTTINQPPPIDPGKAMGEYLFGKSSIKLYRLIYVFVIVLGPVLSLGAVIDFSDLMLLSLAIPNVIGMVFLSKKLRSMVIEYIHDYQTGKFKTFK